MHIVHHAWMYKLNNTTTDDERWHLAGELSSALPTAAGLQRAAHLVVLAHCLWRLTDSTPNLVQRVIRVLGKVHEAIPDHTSNNATVIRLDALRLAATIYSQWQQFEQAEAACDEADILLRRFSRAQITTCQFWYATIQDARSLTAFHQQEYPTALRLALQAAHAARYCPIGRDERYDLLREHITIGLRVYRAEVTGEEEHLLNAAEYDYLRLVLGEFTLNARMPDEQQKRLLSSIRQMHAQYTGPGSDSWEFKTRGNR